MNDARIIVGDCLPVMREMPTDSVDLVFCSPPYEDARTYDIGFSLKGHAWAEWAADRFMECLRVSKGLVAWVVDARTQRFAYSPAVMRLMLAIHDRGGHLRKPPIYKRSGIPGSGGPDWLRNDYEFVVCATSKRERLPWSDNTAMGHPPKYPVGGAMSNRTADGRRRNAKTGLRLKDGRYRMPDKANPGNVIDCRAVGGHNIGSNLAHENEAPFPEKLAEFFVKSFCPPGGLVLDPFVGSGTTLAVADRHGRRSIGIDIRESQADLTRRRVFGEPAPTDGDTREADHEPATN